MRHTLSLLLLSGLGLSLLPDKASADDTNGHRGFASQDREFLLPHLPRRFLFWGQDGDEVQDKKSHRKKQKKKAKKAASSDERPDRASPSAAQTTAPEKANAVAVTCEQAKGIVSEFGFQEVKPSNCTHRVFIFNAMRDGKAYSVKLDSGNGELTEVRKQLPLDSRNGGLTEVQK